MNVFDRTMLVTPHSTFVTMEIEQCDSTNDEDGKNITNDDNKAISCPLFMDGLPSDFSTNPALAAIASLMNDDNPPAITNDDTTKKSLTKKGITKRNERTKYKPYGRSNRQTITTSDECVHETISDAPQHDRRTSSSSKSNISNKAGTTTTIGEASLFLKMWKL